MPAVIPIVAAVAGSAISANASSKAAKTQAAAANAASDASLQAARETNELNKEIYDQNRADNEAWRTAGVDALGALTSYKSAAATPDVAAWYTNALGRHADQGGLAYWQSRIASGERPDDVYQIFLQTAANNGESVNPSAKTWQDASMSAQDFRNVSGFGNTDIGSKLSEYANAKISDTSVPNVAAWYAHAFGREADQSGLNYWESLIRDGGNPDDLYQEFLRSGKESGETINPDARTWRQTAKSAYADTDIGSKSSEYRNPDLATTFGNTDFRDQDGAYADPKLKNLLANFAMSDFEADPGYQYRLEQGGRAVENSAASRGSQLSGATLKALTRFGQNEGAAEYDKAFSRFRTQKLDQYGQAVDDFGRTENQRQEKYAQRGTQYGLDEDQRQSRLALDAANYGRADAQRVDQYGQRVDKFGRDEGQRIDKYGQRADEFGRLEGQREDQYAQRTDKYNRDENQRINRYGISQDQYDRGVDTDTRGYNRLAELAGIGQRVNESNAAGGRAYAGQVSANTSNATTNANLARMAGADARASGTLGRANALTSGLNTAYGLYQQYKQPSMDYNGGTFDYSSTARDPIRGANSY